MFSGVLILAKRLNREGILPRLGLRRNSIYYNLITYVNHTIALLLSESFDDVALFINRADKELKILTSKASERTDSQYFLQCEVYLKKLSSTLLESDVLTASGIDLLPDEYKS